MSDSLGIVIPDYKSDFLEEVIKRFNFGSEKLLFLTMKLQQKIQNKFSHIDFIEFLNFNEKNPGDYRNEGVVKCFSKNLLFLDSDVSFLKICTIYILSFKIWFRR